VQINFFSMYIQLLLVESKNDMQIVILLIGRQNITEPEHRQVIINEISGPTPDQRALCGKLFLYVFPRSF
jgi:hypothetical protein